MQAYSYYASPLGQILLASDGQGLTGSWFENDSYYADNLAKTTVHRETATIQAAKAWLTRYFAQQQPQKLPPLHIMGTPFQEKVWQILQQIPYGTTLTYGAIAQKIAAQKKNHRMSAQAVGGAVGRNHLSIFIPCHRVVGNHGNLTGYGGGLPRKVRLLELEGVDLGAFYVPKNKCYMIK